MGALEADPHRDLAMRYIAEEVVGAIIEKLQDPALAEQALFAIHEAGGARFSLETVIDPERIKRGGADPDDFPKQLSFNVAIVPAADHVGHASWWRGTMTLFILPPYAKEHIRNNPQLFWIELIDNVALSGEALVHESIHMLDQARGNPRFLQPPAYAKIADRSSAKFQREYFKSPEEQNAFFQTAMTEISIALQAHGRGRTRFVLESFDRFEDYAQDYSQSYRQFHTYASERVKRKLTVRMWQNFKLMQEHHQRAAR
jgi:hypothetical protein